MPGVLEPTIKIGGAEPDTAKQATDYSNVAKSYVPQVAPQPMQQTVRCTKRTISHVEEDGLVNRATRVRWMLASWLSLPTTVLSPFRP
jgi:hypothetical protein